MEPLLADRQEQIHRTGEQPFTLVCNKDSLAGAVSQRACVFCGSRVVLYPIADALHLVHGPIGCAVYTWDIRGALSSGPELHRLSFSTDLQERDVIFGGEKNSTAPWLSSLTVTLRKGFLSIRPVLSGSLGTTWRRSAGGWRRRRECR
jgi:nitrogenase molybdenum-cofactor synthesis protein NifE